jgi:elongation factor Ts
LNIPTERIKELREKSGAGIMECRNALLEAEGHIEKALQILKKQNLAKAEKKKNRSATQGLIECYVHTGGRIAAIVEVNCETDFVARTDEFKELAHNLAMQVAAMNPRYLSPQEIPAGAEIDPKSACLLIQPYIRDQSLTVQDLIDQTIAKIRENIKVSRFVRFEVGE